MPVCVRICRRPSWKKARRLDSGALWQRSVACRTRCSAGESKPPAIILVGEVCTLAGQFHWAEDRPLGGARVVVTRPKKLASRLGDRLRELGAEVIELPAIETVEIEDNMLLEQALSRIEEYNWLVFTSQAGVEVFFNRLIKSAIDIRKLCGLKIAAIGSATKKALLERGLFTDCMPKTFDSVHLGKVLTEYVKPGEKLLIPRARIGSVELTQILGEHGISYDDIPVYDTVYETNALLHPKNAFGAECGYVRGIYERFHRPGLCADGRMGRIYRALRRFVSASRRRLRLKSMA